MTSIWNSRYLCRRTQQSCLTGQCLRDRRIGDLTELQKEIAVWSEKTNVKQRGLDGQFRIESARAKLKRLYPKGRT